MLKIKCGRSSVNDYFYLYYKIKSGVEAGIGNDPKGFI